MVHRSTRPVEEKPQQRHGHHDCHPEEERAQHPRRAIGGGCRGDRYEPEEGLPRLIVREELPRNDPDDAGRLVERDQIGRHDNLMHQRPRHIDASVRRFHTHTLLVRLPAHRISQRPIRSERPLHRRSIAVENQRAEQPEKQRHPPGEGIRQVRHGKADDRNDDEDPRVDSQRSPAAAECTVEAVGSKPALETDHPRILHDFTTETLRTQRPPCPQCLRDALLRLASIMGIVRRSKQETPLRRRSRRKNRSPRLQTGATRAPHFASPL